MSEAGYLLIGLLVGILIRFERAHRTGWSEGFRTGYEAGILDTDSEWLGTVDEPYATVKRDGKQYVANKVLLEMPTIEEYPWCEE